MADPTWQPWPFQNPIRTAPLESADSNVSITATASGSSIRAAPKPKPRKPKAMARSTTINSRRSAPRWPAGDLHQQSSGPRTSRPPSASKAVEDGPAKPIPSAAISNPSMAGFSPNRNQQQLAKSSSLSSSVRQPLSNPFTMSSNFQITAKSSGPPAAPLDPAAAR
ncbi:hypothetical protein ACLOJK_011281 [Asimina triloba]